MFFYQTTLTNLVSLTCYLSSYFIKSGNKVINSDEDTDTENARWALPVAETGRVNVFADDANFFVSDQRADLAIQDLYDLKISIIGMLDLIAICVTFLTELPIVLFHLLFSIWDIYFALVCVVCLKLIKEERKHVWNDL